MGKNLVRFVTYLMVALFSISTYILLTENSIVWQVIAGLSVLLGCAYFGIQDAIRKEDEESD